MDGFSLNGLTVKEAIAKTKQFVTEKGIGRVKVNYRLRDAIFSRQRYWGEPFPVYYKQGMPYMIPEECLPLELTWKSTSMNQQKAANHHWVVQRFGLGMRLSVRLLRSHWLTIRLYSHWS